MTRQQVQACHWPEFRTFKNQSLVLISLVLCVDFNDIIEYSPHLARQAE